MSKESLQEFPIKHEHISWNHIESTSVVNQKNGILLGRFMLCYKPCFLNLRTRSPLNHIKTCVLSFVFLLLATTMLLRAIFILNLDHSRQDLKAETDGERRSRRESRTCPEVGSLPKYFTWISSPGLNPSSLASSTCSVDKM